MLNSLINNDKRPTSTAVINKIINVRLNNITSSNIRANKDVKENTIIQIISVKKKNEINEFTLSL